MGCQHIIPYIYNQINTRFKIQLDKDNDSQTSLIVFHNLSEELLWCCKFKIPSKKYKISKSIGSINTWNSLQLNFYIQLTRQSSEILKLPICLPYEHLKSCHNGDSCFFCFFQQSSHLGCVHSIKNYGVMFQSMLHKKQKGSYHTGPNLCEIKKWNKHFQTPINIFHLNRKPTSSANGRRYDWQ